MFHSPGAQRRPALIASPRSKGGVRSAAAPPAARGVGRLLSSQKQRKKYGGMKPPSNAATSPRTATVFMAGRFRPFFSFCLLRIAPRAAPARMQFSCASTDDRRTNDATSGPQEWLTGSLHDGGTRSVRSPLRRAPLPATPIATPLQCGRPKRPGPFCFLNYSR